MSSTVDPVTVSLRAIPAVALQALERMSDPELSVPELAGIIRNDPAIVARLLSVANSAACGLQVKVSDPQQVVALLGKPAVISIVLSLALAPPGDIPPGERHHYRRYWTEAVMMATSAERLARNVDSLKRSLLKPADFFTAGLLADVGRLAFLQNQDIDYAGVLDEAIDNGEFPRAAEERLLGTTHVAASMVLLRMWNAPEFIRTAVKHHHHSPDVLDDIADSSDRDLAGALIFSAAVVDYLCGTPKAELLDRVAAIGATLFSFQEAEVERHIEEVLDRMTETADLFTILPTDVDVLRSRFLAGLETAAHCAINDHVQARTAVAAERSNLELRAQLETLTVRASRDSLTGAFNREYFEACLAHHLADRSKPVGVVFVDVDSFKQINDSYGHVVGDQVLKGIAGLLQDSLRPSDLLARFGGDEFVLLITDATATGLQRVAERLQQAVANTPFGCDGVAYSATISVGGALIPPDDSAPQAVPDAIALADAAMYEAKLSGKNRVHISETRPASARGPEDRMDKFISGLKHPAPEKD